MEFTKLLENMGIDAQETLRRFGGSETMLKKYLGKFGEEETFGRLEAAVANKDSKAVEMEAHALKGLSANMGMTALSQSCARMVDAIRQGTADDLDGMFEQVNEEYVQIKGWLSQME